MYGKLKRIIDFKNKKICELQQIIFNYEQKISHDEIEQNILCEQINNYKEHINILNKTKERLKDYEVITLCGSTKFKDDFIRVQEELTLQGKIVISVGLFGHADNKYGNEITKEVKEMLDDIHKRKIDLSNAIYVINKNGYIGKSTKSEIEYAKITNKKVYYMEDIKEN